MTTNRNKIAVIGLGYVGLPLATLCAKKGYRVIGLDNNQEIVNSINSGVSHIRDKETEKLLSEAIASGNLEATIDSKQIEKCDIYIICVPTPITDNLDPDFKPIEESIKTISPYVKKGNLVVLESTVFPGTCEEFVIPMLEKWTNLSVGKDFELAHCPERINPGDLFWNIENIPRVIGATTKEGAKHAAKFYASVLGGEVLEIREIRGRLRPKFSRAEDYLNISHVPLGSITVMNTLRSDVLNLNVVDIIDGMSTKPFGKGPFYPGIGVGGHCIAVDPEWLKAASKKAGYMPEIIQMARVTNNSMPQYAISLLQDALNESGLPLKGTKIAILGVSYKKNVDDPRESPFFAVYNTLSKKGAILRVYDSWVNEQNNVSSLQEAVKDADAILIVTDHDDMVEQLKQIDFENTSIKVIVDGRNCLSADEFNKAGIIYRGIGRS